MLPELDLHKIQRRTLAEATAQVDQVGRYAKSFSLIELINSRIAQPLFTPDQRKLESINELSESCRQRTGVNPNGTWVPLAALSRDLTTSSAAYGVAPNVGKTLQGALAAQSAVMGGATILSGLSGSTFGLAGINSAADSAGAWVSEGVAGPQREPTFKVSTLTPKTLVVEMIISRSLVANSSVDIEQELRTELLRSVMQEVDRAALCGTGSDGSPLGLLNNEAIEVLTTAAPNGTAPTWDDIANAEYAVSTRVNSMRAPTFVTSPKLRRKLRSTQRGIGLDFICNDRADALMGHPLLVSPLVPDNLTKGTSSACTALLFGDLAELYVGFWGPLAIDVLVDGYTYSGSGKIRLIARCDVGVAPRHLSAFTCFKDFLWT